MSAPTLGMQSVRTGGLIGLDFQAITVEVASRRGPSTFQLAGLAETSVREARIRLSSALSRIGITLDEYALTVNLAPANVRKGGSGLDLALAVGILGAIGKVELPEATDLFLGEVSLDGSLRPIPGILPLLSGAISKGCARAFIPWDNQTEAALLRGIEVIAVRCVEDLLAHFSGKTPLKALTPRPYQAVAAQGPELHEVRGQAAAKRALLIAAAGNHHLLLVGPPGSGKSLLARRLPGLLPPLSVEQALATTSLHSIAGLLAGSTGIVSAPPFRAPHHTVSDVGLVGGGSQPRPGEISLAHHGVLFLDELPEFRRSALEALRQPLEEQHVSIVRARCATRFPAQPLVVAAMNPCPCGNWGNPRAACRCSESARMRYLSRVSGPLLDRIDLHVMVPPVDLRSFHEAPAPELSSEKQAARVQIVRALQAERHQRLLGRPITNAALSLDQLKLIAPVTKDAQGLLDLAIEKNLLSARGYVRVLRIARTISDLAESRELHASHVGEALRYRISDLAEC